MSHITMLTQSGNSSNCPSYLKKKKKIDVLGDTV